MAEVCKPLQKLMLSKATWTWDASYQQQFEKAKMLIKAEMCMKYDNKPFYLETDASRIGLGTALLQLRDDTSCQTHMVPDNTILCICKQKP